MELELTNSGCELCIFCFCSCLHYIHFEDGLLYEMKYHTTTSQLWKWVWEIENGKEQIPELRWH